ncbi:MAG: YidC/Oxa1 family membrane protein insertase [bacterium]
MFSSFYNNFLYHPLYNGLVYLIGVVPYHDVGIAVVVLTLVVKFILFPLSKKSVVTQIKMKQLDPELKALQAKYKDNRQELSQQLLTFYKKNQLNPFSGLFLILLQLPIIFALYKVFYSGDIHIINTTILYSFVGIPAAINTIFLGIFDLAIKHSLFLSIFVGITQFIQAQLVVPPHDKTKPIDPKDMGQNLARSMNTQMKYVLPVFVAFISYSLASLVSVYWITSNIFAIGQELYFRKTIKKKS